MAVHTINIGKNFSETPSGRYSPKHGKNTGERFRDEFLAPLLREYGSLAVELDDTEGYGSSFLEEAFGGLVRHKLFTKEELCENLLIITHDEAYKNEIFEYINEAKPGDIPETKD